MLSEERLREIREQYESTPAGRMVEEPFVKASRHDVPDLLAEVERLRAENAELRRDLLRACPPAEGY